MHREQQDLDYYMKRFFASTKAAQAATNSLVKLVHLDFAERYSMAATHLLPTRRPETCGTPLISASPVRS